MKLEEMEERVIRLEELVLQQQKELAELYRMMDSTDELAQTDFSQKEEALCNAADKEEGTKVLEEETKKTPQKQTDMEGRVGGMMGIVASIMVFISIILFVTMVYSSLSDIIKLVCIFLFSFAVLGAGVRMMQKEINVFSMSLTGCGMGTVYLSLFITHLYFGYMNQIVLYLLIAVWAAGVYYFFGKNYAVFKIIGQVGITMAVIFGNAMLSLSPVLKWGNEGWGKLLFLVVFFIISSWFYLLADKTNTDRYISVGMFLNETAMLFFFLRGGTFSQTIVEEYRTYAVAYMILLIVCQLMFLWRYVASGENGEKDIRGKWYVVWLFFGMDGLWITICRCLKGTFDPVVFAVCVPVAAALLAIELSRKKQDIIHLFSTALIYVLLLNATRYLGGYHWMGFFLAVYGIVLLLAGYHFADCAAIYLSYLSIVLSAIYAVEGAGLVAAAAMCAVLIVLAGFFLYNRKEQYHIRLKISYYPAVQIAVYIITEKLLFDAGLRWILARAWGYVFCALLSVAACQSFFSRSFDEKEEYEKSFVNEAYLINAIMMSAGSVYLAEQVFNNAMRFVLLCVVAAVYLVNFMPLLKRFGDVRWTGIYNGFKLSIFIYCVLKSYSLTGPLISIGWLVLALLLICAGFALEYKYMRVYGLGLTMFSICKLLIFDITYHNPALRAFCFLLSGVLCFLINLLYNKMQKEQNE